MERVLDTSIIIAIARNNERVINYLLENHKNTTFYITAITRFELKCGKTKDIEDLYINMLKTLPFDDRSADVAAYIYREHSKDGRIPSIKDLFIASICIANNLTLITLDRDFEIFKEFGLNVEIL
ncbi:type II toxin-antitoxin system VapC family toxin [Archaeoglobus sp.]